VIQWQEGLSISRQSPPLASPVALHSTNSSFAHLQHGREPHRAVQSASGLATSSSRPSPSSRPKVDRAVVDLARKVRSQQSLLGCRRGDEVPPSGISGSIRASVVSSRILERKRDRSVLRPSDAPSDKRQNQPRSSQAAQATSPPYLRDCEEHARWAERWRKPLKKQTDELSRQN
jgi:hypothetical protein